MSFPGCTLPGVMTAGAAQTMTNLYQVLPEKKSSWWVRATWALSSPIR
jgi:hypothetical protein